VTLRPTLHYQRRYKSNKRKDSVAQPTAICLELFWDFLGRVLERLSADLAGWGTSIAVGLGPAFFVTAV